MSNTMMDFIGMPSGTFPGSFKGPDARERLSSGQKVVCTPEVILYTYENGSNAAPSPTSRISVDDKGGGRMDLDVPPSVGLHTANGFQCGVCGKIFQQKNTFQNHLRSHREGEDPYQCDICGKTFAVPARLTRHYRTHTGEKPYQCEFCNKSFSVKENLSVHRRIHTKERPYKCEVCERAFEHSGKLHRHMRIHTGERPHRCQICQKTFIQSGQLVIHMRTHTGEKPYVCKVCSKGFTCSKQLKVHSRTHTGEKPYSCDICGKSFGYNHVLKLHQVAHYGEKVYKCTLCNSTFNSKKALETHIKTHSSSDTMSPSITPPLEGTHTHIVQESRILSSPQINGAPQHSDKENRESSDSEISSQNSPNSLESPRSPASPTIYTNSGRTGGGGGSNPKTVASSHYSSNNPNPVNNNGGPSSLPYPMLPPGVQIHQPPQSRTTFLYVTSKLPQVTNTRGTNPTSLNNGFRANTPNFNAKNLHVKSSPPRPTDISREKFLRQSASIRDKVLASIEMFGYGISGDSNSSNGSTDLSIRGKGVQITPVSNVSGSSFNFGRGKYQDSTINRNTMSGAVVREGDVSITPVPENLTNYTRQFRDRSRDEGFYNNPYSYPSSYPISKSTRENSRSPEPRGGYNFGSGGVLALALTRGSKAVVNQLPFSVSMTPVRTLTKSTSIASGTHTPPHSNPESPDLCIDFSRKSGSVSPRNNGFNSPTPSTTPRSTPGLSESTEDLSDEYNHHHKETVEIVGLGKRTMSNGSNYGPRKRSSLILEKYAQENPSSPHPTSKENSTESILSQRLRQSTVIQYAERCT